MSFTELDNCQYLRSSPINYTVTNLADPLDGISHDRINRYLRGEKLTPRLLCDNVKVLLQPCQNAYILFDDTVWDKWYASSIELTKRQCSGNEHRVIHRIGLISCVYVNGKTGQFWVIDYRLYDPDGDGQSKLDPVAAMLDGVIHSKQFPFAPVLMDSWYATQKLMAQIDQLDKLYYCPLKTNRRGEDSGGTAPYARIDDPIWTRLKTIAYQSGRTIYQIKHGMLSDYLSEQLKHPSVQMSLA